MTLDLVTLVCDVTMLLGALWAIIEKIGAVTVCRPKSFQLNKAAFPASKYSISVHVLCLHKFCQNQIRFLIEILDNFLSFFSQTFFSVVSLVACGRKIPQFSDLQMPAVSLPVGIET